MNTINLKKDLNLTYTKNQNTGKICWVWKLTQLKRVHKETELLK